MDARPIVAALVLLLAGCAAAEENDGQPPASTTQAGSPGGHDAPAWPAGILYRDPVTGRLAAVDATPRSLGLQPGGFDLAAGVLAQGDNGNRIRWWPAEGTQGSVVAQGIHHVGRVSLDPQGAAAVVQATSGPGAPDPPNDFDVYRVDLASGATTRIGGLDDNEESPEWSRDGARIAYSSFSPEAGIDLHVVDAATLQETRVIDDAGGIHLSFSADGSRILEAGRLRIHDVATGTMTHDLRDEALAGLAAAGYAVEDRYPGQANRGTFPLDGGFSPDGTRLVFDGAVRQGPDSAIVVATMGVDGTGFAIVAGPFVVDPDVTNGLNYSEVNPVWL